MRPTVLVPMLAALALLPAAPALAGCGGCQSAAPVLYAQPQVAPILYAQPRPVPVYAWPQQAYSSCGGCASYGAVSVVDTQPRYAKQPIYIVNQGPHYSGSGIMVTQSTWSHGASTAGYPYAQSGLYDGGPYADPMGPAYSRRYGYHEQVPAGYADAPSGPRIITYRHRGPRYYRPIVLRAKAQIHQAGGRTDMRSHRATPAKRRNHGY
jgi:hypothetical protein